jgi:hypothetical protein
MLSRPSEVYTRRHRPYKKDNCDPISASDYAIRYDNEGNVFAKTKGGQEFRTEFKENKTAWDVSISGITITKEEYDNF